MKYVTLLAICLAFGLLLVTACDSEATTVEWMGRTWDNNTWGNLNEVSGAALILHQAGPFTDYYRAEAHYATDSTFRSWACPSVSTTFNDDYANIHGGGGCISANYVVGEDLVWSASIRTVPGQWYYTIEEYVGGQWTAYTTNVGRTTGVHTFRIAKRFDGKIEYYVDGGQPVRTSTVQGPSCFTDIMLWTWCNPTLFPGTGGPISTTFTDYETTAEWRGQTWDNTSYGNVNDSATSPGDLIVNQTGLWWTNYYVGEAHYTTDTTFREWDYPSVAMTFNDDYVSILGGGGCLRADYVVDGALQWSSNIRTIPGSSNYQIQEYISGSWGNEIDTGVTRTAGAHTFRIAKRFDGYIVYYVDGGQPVRTTTVAGPSCFSDVMLYTWSNPTGFPGTGGPVNITFTDYQTTTNWNGHTWDNATYGNVTDATGKDLVVYQTGPFYTMFWSDGFESGDFTAGGWTNSGCTVQTTYKYSGTYAARIDRNYSLTKSYSTAGKGDITVEYARRTQNMGLGDHFISEWYDGSAWIPMEDLTGEHTDWTVQQYALPSGANNNADFRIRFRTDNGIVGFANLDDVKISGSQCKYQGEAHYTTDSAFRALDAPSVSTTFDDEYADVLGGGGCLRADYVDGSLQWSSSIRTIPGSSTYQIEEYAGSQWNSYDTGVSRSEGLHTFRIAKRFDDYIEYYVDGGQPVRTTGVTGPSCFTDIKLFTWSNSEAFPSTGGPVNIAFTDFQTSTIWKGHTWDNTSYGNVNDADTSPGNLVIYHTGPFWTNYYEGEAHYTTDSEFRSLATPWAQTTFNDEHASVHGPGGCLTLEGPNWHASIRTEPGQWYYTVVEHIGSDPWNTYLSTVSRTAGAHTFKIIKNHSGHVEYYIDGNLARTSVALGPQYFTDIKVWTWANPTDFPGTGGPASIMFTDFQTNQSHLEVFWKGFSWKNSNCLNPIEVDSSGNMVVTADYPFSDYTSCTSGLTTPTYYGNAIHILDASMQAAPTPWIQAEFYDNTYGTSIYGPVLAVGARAKTNGQITPTDGWWTGMIGCKRNSDCYEIVDYVQCVSTGVHRSRGHHTFMIAREDATGQYPYGRVLYYIDGNQVAASVISSQYKCDYFYQAVLNTQSPQSQGTLSSVFTDYREGGCVKVAGDDNSLYFYSGAAPVLHFNLTNMWSYSPITAHVYADVRQFPLTDANYSWPGNSYPTDCHQTITDGTVLWSSTDLGPLTLQPNVPTAITVTCPSSWVPRRYDMTLRVVVDSVTTAYPAAYFYITNDQQYSDMVGLGITSTLGYYNPSPMTHRWALRDIVAERRVNSMLSSNPLSLYDSLFNSIGAVGLKCWVHDGLGQDGPVGNGNGGGRCFDDPTVQSVLQQRVQYLAEETAATPTVSLVCWENEPGGFEGIHDPQAYDPGDACFRAWLQTRYVTLSALNTAWNTSYSDWAQVTAPAWNARNFWVFNPPPSPPNNSCVLQNTVGSPPTPCVCVTSGSPGNPNTHQALDWKRWAWGSYVQYWQYASTWFKQVNSDVAFNTNIVGPMCWPGFCSGISAYLDCGGLDQFVPGGHYAQQDYLTKTLNALDMLESMYAPKPLVMHEHYIHSVMSGLPYGDPLNLPNAQAWCLAGRGFRTSYFFMWDWFDSGLTGCIDDQGQPIHDHDGFFTDPSNTTETQLFAPTFSESVPPSSSCLVQQFKQFHSDYDLTSMRRVTPKVGIYVSSDNWLTYDLTTGDCPWTNVNYNSQVGLYWLVRRNGYEVDYLDDSKLGSLSDYTVVLVPRTDIITQAAVTSLMDYVEDGGTVIADGLLGAGDEMGYRYSASPGGDAMDVVGWNQTDLSWTGPSGGRTLTAVQGNSLGLTGSIPSIGTPQGLVNTTVGEVIMRDGSNNDGLVRRNLGSGILFYFTSCIGSGDPSQVLALQYPAQRVWVDENLNTVMTTLLQTGAGLYPRMFITQDPNNKTTDLQTSNNCTRNDLNGDGTVDENGNWRLHPYLEGSMRVKSSDDKLYIFLVSWFGGGNGWITLSMPTGYSYAAKDAITGSAITLTDLGGGQWQFQASSSALPAWGSRVVEVRCTNGSPFAGW